MEHPDSLNSVGEFHRFFQIPIEPKPCIPSAERCKLRVSLIQEELNELSEAIKQNDLVEVADALADIQYVLSGCILEFGMAHRFKSLFDEVHRSNMSKACQTVEEAQATVEYYTKERDTPCHYKEVEGLYMVYRNSDTKLLKSVKYSPCDLEPILNDDKEN